MSYGIIQKPNKPRKSNLNPKLLDKICLCSLFKAFGVRNFRACSKVKISSQTPNPSAHNIFVSLI